jgi:hypothetical protein
MTSAIPRAEVPVVFEGKLMLDCATTVMAWQGAAPAVISDVLIQAGECAEIAYPRDGRRFEPAIMHAPRP